jgi:hypothetical protein
MVGGWKVWARWRHLLDVVQRAGAVEEVGEILVKRGDVSAVSLRRGAEKVVGLDGRETTATK